MNAKCLERNVSSIAVLLTALAAGSVAARTVTVASCDRSTGATVLSISAAEAGDGAKALVAAWSPYDVGNVVTNARETVYVGAVAAADTEKSFTIPAAWREKAGIVRFFLMADVPPYDARLASLYAPSGSTAWIDTGFVPGVNSDIRVTLAYGSNGQWIPFGIVGRCYLFPRYLADSVNYWVDYMGTSADYPPSGNGGGTVQAPAGKNRHEYRLNAKGAYIDGICYAPFNPASLTNSTTVSLSLFGRRNADGTIQATRMGDGTIFAAQLRENGTLVHDYVPCRKNGVATLYDRKTGVFCTINGSGSYTEGSEIGPDAQDCGGVESASDALAFGPALTVTAVNVGTAEATVSFTGAHDEGVLYAVADTADRGATVSAWANIHFLGKVAADAETATFSLPGIWFSNGYQMRFFWRSAADFPYDREVEWLYDEGTAWVNSGVIPTMYTKVSVHGKSPLNVCLFGIATYFFFFPNGDSKYYSGFFGLTDNFSVGNYNPSTMFRTYTLGPEGVEIDGTRIVDFAGRTPTYTKLNYATPIFYRRDYGNGAISKPGLAWVKWAKIWEDGQLVRDFVPCVSNGVATLYDRVSHEFRTRTGTFTPGETVVAVADEEAVVWSSAFSPAAAASATWDGGGADTSFATAANWEGDELPDYASGGTILTFATGGSAAQVPASGAFAGGVRFDTTNNFALTAASGGTLSLGAGGLMLANRALPSGTTWRMHDLNLPVVVAADQTWDMSTVGNGGGGQRLRVLGNLQGSADRTLTITGSGCLSLYATNDFAGNVVLDGGVMKVFSQVRPFGSAAEGGEIVIDQSKRATFEMWACVIDKPIRVTSSALAGEGNFAAYGTCAITAPIYQTGTDRLVIKQETVASYGDAVLTLSGGGSFVGPVEFFPEKTALRKLVVEGMPIIQPVLGDRNKAFKFHGKTELHLKNPGNRMYIELGAADKGTGSSLHCWTNNVLNHQSDIILGYGSTLDLHGTEQQVGDLQTGSAGHIRSDEPATLLAYYDSGNGITWGVNAGIDGAVTFRKSGPKSLTINGTNTTTGALIAFAGPLVMGTTACWQGTNVCIGLDSSNRHPSMRLTRSNTFANPTKTVLTMTTTTESLGFYTECGTSREPELILDAGVNAVFKDVILNGRHLAVGTWGGLDSSAQHKDGEHFSGSGMITVIGSGMMIIFR